MDHTKLTPKQLAELERQADAIVARVCSLEHDLTTGEAMLLVMFRDITRDHYAGLTAEIAALQEQVAALRAREALTGTPLMRQARDPRRSRYTKTEKDAYDAGYNRGYMTRKRTESRR